jgi:peptide deformylase
MAIKQILMWGDPRLNALSKPVTDDDSVTELTDLVRDLFDTMRHGNGLGLAAPQIGVMKRVFVMDIGKGDPRVFVNPFIVETDGVKTPVYEGCLSLPGVREQVDRFSDVTLYARCETSYDHFTGEQALFTVQVQGLEAQCVQHENDHLNGHLFVDGFKPMKLARLKEQFQRSIGGRS